MESCDILIVGGGPAGSTLAWKLRKKGIDVVVMDKSEFPRDKVCAGWITPPVLEALQIEKEEYGRGRTLQPIHAFVTGIMGESEVLTVYGEPVSFGIRRCEFDHYLLERSGARLMSGEALRTIRRENSHWIVNEAVKTSLLIGAGGHFCPVARFLGAGDSQEAGIVAQEMEFELNEAQQETCWIRPDTPELFFCDDLKGYGWCVRKGNFLNIGLGRNDKIGLSGHVKFFNNFLRLMGKIPDDAPANFKGHAYLLYSRVSRKVADDGVMLIGDSAGLAYPQSGEGIRPAVESALMASEVILTADGNYQRDKLQIYQKMLKERFGDEQGPIFSFIPEGVRLMAVRRLMKSKWFSRKIILDRWFLQSHQRPLAA